MFKKALSLLLSLMLIVTSICVTAISVSAADDVTYVVAGVPALCDAEWKGDTVEGADNIMTQNADGTYSKVFTDVAVMNDYQFKVVANDAAGNMTWYGIDGGNDNVTFHVIEACDVTVTFDPTTLKLTVTGDGVEIPTSLQIDAMRTVGNGDGAWLNGVAWDPADDDNVMTETSTGVYEITYTDMDQFENYQVKFAANGSWAVNWGGVYAGSGVETDAVFNGQDNITFDVPYELANVTIKLDIRNFDYATKTGAKFTITVTDATEVTTDPVETTVPVVETTAPVVETTVAPTTEAPVADGLTVKATSNLFAEYTQNVPSTETQVTVTYMIDCAKDMLNTQWKLTYDPAVLSFNRDANLNSTGRGFNFMPQVAANGVFNAGEPGKILGNATDLGLYALSNNGPVTFVTVTFDIIGSGSTVVDLYVDVLNVSALGDNFMTDESQEESIVDFGVVQEFTVALDKATYVYPGTYNPAPTYPETTVAPTTEVPTTVAPTTVAPTTEPTAPVADATYVVAGSETFCGVNWDGLSPENVMALTGDVYTKVYEFVAPGRYQLKVVENLADGTQNWIGDETDNNITFDVLAECDVTVTFDPATRKITVTGAGVQMVTELEIDAIRAVGNGDGTWLNGVAWGPAADENIMNEIADKVYSITFEDVDEFDNYQVKFAANGDWTDNWGGNFIDSGLETDAEYNSASNITFAVPYELADVTITLDLTNFNYAAKTGAKFTVTIVDATEVEPADTLKVTATSNFFGTDDITVKATDDKTVTVTYNLQSEKDLMNAQWELSYDKNLLALESVTMPNTVEGSMITEDMTKGSCSNLSLYDFKSSKEFVVATFKVLGTGETEVNLNVTDLTVSKVNANGVSDENEEVTVVENSDPVNTDGILTNTVITEGGAVEVPTTVAPTTTEPTTVAPTTTEPVEDTTTAPVEPTTPSTEDEVPTETPDATSATGVTTGGTSTSDTPSSNNKPNTNSGAVQTGNASMAIVILLVLVSASAVLYFARKRVR